MKKLRIFKGVVALSVISAMTLTVCTTVFADSTFTGSNGVVSIVEGNSITIRKDILVTNTDPSVTRVYGPDITYQYTVEPISVVSEVTKVTDEGDNFLFVKSGIAESISLTDDKAVFTSGEVLLTDGEATISDTIEAQIDPTKFDAPGIYRYAITEDASTSFTPKLAEQAMSRDISNYKNRRYLDVYVKNGNSGFEINGYVLFAAATGQAIIDGRAGHTDTSTGFIGKTEGFVDTVNTESAGGSWAGKGTLVDKYNTYNLKITKKITGDLADTSHQFPFTLSTEVANITGRQFSYSVNVDGITGEMQTNSIGTDITTNLGNNDNITIYGLPATAKFDVTERNDTSDEYKTTVSDTISKILKNAIPVPTDTSIHAFGETTAAKSQITNYTTINEAITQRYEDMIFENTLYAVSPTGVILRAMPYAILFGAAIVLVVLYIRSKKEKSSEDIL